VIHALSSPTEPALGGVDGRIKSGHDSFRIAQSSAIKPLTQLEEDSMQIVGLGFYFEELPVGRQFKTIGRTVTEADITNFVNCTGMVEVLFTNLEFLAHESDIKQRLAPAALVWAFAEGLLVQSTMQHTGFAFLHMELNVENPVFAGDTIHAECEVVEARRSKSRPDRGLVRTRIRVLKQDGTVALTYTPLRMVKCRELTA
jgi:acyl dehydratase